MDGCIRETWLHRFGRILLSDRPKEKYDHSGGINLYPEEIEEILLQHPDIEEACVFAEPDAILNEVPAAKIKVSDRGIDIHALHEYCSQRLASYKVPTQFYIVEELPKTYNGKLKRY